MILSDHSIEGHLGSSSIETISADPMPDDEQIQPASLDVRLGKEIYSFEYDERLNAPEIILEPGKRYLGHTVEEIDLPKDIAAQLAGRSTIGRMGIIVHKTAGWVDPNFCGQITLEIMNLGNEPVSLEKGKRVAQLVFFKLDQMSTGYDGSYQQQEGATKSR